MNTISGTPLRQGRIRSNNYPKPGPMGNTVGVILAKTRSALPGAPSNPPIVAETEAEARWLQRQEAGSSLDVSCHSEGDDEVNARLNAAAAVPFAGKSANAPKAAGDVNQPPSIQRAPRFGSGGGSVHGPARGYNQDGKSSRPCC